MNIQDFLKAGEYTGKVNSLIDVNGALVCNTLYFNNYEPRWHCHENMNMCMVFSNSKSEFRHKANYSTREGSLFFYHSGEVHKNSVYDPISKSINIELPAEYLKALNLKEENIEKNVRSTVNLRTLMLAINNEIQSNSKENAVINTEPYILELISSAKDNNAKSPFWVKSLRDFMHDNWNKQYDLKKLSNEIKVHPVTISKYFKKYFNCSFTEYRRKLKVERSIELIRDKDISLTEVAYRCNFADQSHFIRTFKKRTGFLPKDLRKY